MDDRSARVDVAFVCAMPMELRPLVRRLGVRASRVDRGEVHVGSLGGRSVVATCVGMGTDRARGATLRLLDGVAVGWVVVVGITGAVDDETPIGSLVVPEVVIDAATGVEHRPAPLDDRAPRGVMWTTDELYTDPEEVAALRSRGVVSLDMETAAVAGACEARGVPWSVVRAISDRATDGSVDADVLALSRPDGSPAPGAVIRHLLGHPGRVPNLVRLARGARHATTVAADAAIAACSHG